VLPHAPACRQQRGPRLRGLMGQRMSLRVKWRLSPTKLSQSSPAMPRSGSVQLATTRKRTSECQRR
jgi:hypothetical protein